MLMEMVMQTTLLTFHIAHSLVVLNIHVTSHNLFFVFAKRVCGKSRYMRLIYILWPHKLNNFILMPY